MASDLVPFTVSAPGFWGLNLQDSPVSLAPEYALEATNCVIDKFGRVGARKGWETFSATEAGIGTAPVTLIHEFINDAGTSYILFIANGKIWSMNTSTGAVTSIYTGTWTSAGGAGDYNWKAVTFNNNAYFFKRGEDPLVFTAASTVVKVSVHGSYSGTVQQANEVLSAYGRLWTADTSTDKTTIKWSDTLIGQAWTGGASGSLDLEKVYTNGTRPIIALAAFNGNLIIFCDTCIIIYSGADDDPSTNLALVEVIDGVGCIARDSVQDIGNDIFFLSETGVRSLGRIISEKSPPLNDISRNVRDSLMLAVANNEDNEDIKSAYNATEGFYLLTLPNASVTYCFDLKNRLEGGVCRPTTWSLCPYCYIVDKTQRMFMGFAGYVGLYTGYFDNDSETYSFLYISSHLNAVDGNKPETAQTAPFYKILKNLRSVLLSNGAYQVEFLWGFDYSGLTHSTSKLLAAPTQTYPEYSESEYSIAEYSSIPNDRVLVQRIPVSGYGQVFQFGISATINGNTFSVQQVDLYYKPGRLA